jgi:two-component system CheB/CheR fusion protein
MVFREALELSKPERHHTLQIFGTDLDQAAIDKARQGLYPPNIAADVSPERLRRFFSEDERGFRVSRELDMVIFAPQNVLTDPPFTRLDLLTCRNLLIYLVADVQKKLFPLFHYALNRGGILLLGTSESVGGATSLFVPSVKDASIFRRLDGPSRAHILDSPPPLHVFPPTL